MRLVAASPPPPGWRPSGWRPAGPVRRCGCGAPVIASSSRWTRCERAIHLTSPARPVAEAKAKSGRPKGNSSQTAKSSSPPKTAKKTPKKAKATPAVPSAEHLRYMRLLPALRVLEAQLVRDQLRGRPAGAKTIELAVRALRLFHESCPSHTEEIHRALPFLSRKAERAA